VYINHIFLIQSSLDGHLGCFHILAIVNSAAMSMRVHVSFLRKVLSGYMPKSWGLPQPNESEILEMEPSNLFLLIERSLIYNVMFVSGAQHCDSIFL